MKFSLLCLIFVCLLLINCSVSENVDPTISLDEIPKYSDREFITFEKKYSIDTSDITNFFLSDVRNFDLDSKDNLYVTSWAENKIFIFDKNGNFLRELGELGYGAKELMKPQKLFIADDKIHIYESRRGIKVWTLDGEFIEFFRLKDNVSNPVFKYSNGNIFGVHFEYLLNTRDEAKNFKATYKLIRYSEEMDEEINITSMDVWRGKFRTYHPAEFVAINSEGHIFYPKEPDKYIINKFNKNGEVILSFGRNYVNKKYTEKIVKRFKRDFGRENWPIPEYPPIVRHIMIDKYDHVWVVIGEWFQDINNLTVVKSTIDIFDKNGAFLYTFTSDKISNYSFIKNDLLYSGATRKPLKYAELYQVNPYINVYKINYDFMKKN